jgi:hypothetical protein
LYFSVKGEDFIDCSSTGPDIRLAFHPAGQAQRYKQASKNGAREKHTSKFLREIEAFMDLGIFHANLRQDYPPKQAIRRFIGAVGLNPLAKIQSVLPIRVAIVRH